MSFSEINDIREQPEFKGLSFSNYKRSDVKKQLITNLLNGKIENSNYWCAELICSGNFPELWDTIIHFIIVCETVISIMFHIIKHTSM